MRKRTDDDSLLKHTDVHNEFCLWKTKFGFDTFTPFRISKSTRIVSFFHSFRFFLFWVSFFVHRIYNGVHKFLYYIIELIQFSWILTFFGFPFKSRYTPTIEIEKMSTYTQNGSDVIWSILINAFSCIFLSFFYFDSMKFRYHYYFVLICINWMWSINARNFENRCLYFYILLWFLLLIIFFWYSFSGEQKPPFRIPFFLFLSSDLKMQSRFFLFFSFHRLLIVYLKKNIYSNYI